MKKVVLQTVLPLLGMMFFSGGCCSSETLTPSIELPAWLRQIERRNRNQTYPGDEAKIRFVIALACRNVSNGTGGPFGAAIFDAATDRLVAVGVNCVVPANQSWAHAEMTAFSHAQHLRNTYELKGCILVTSCEPCAMCYGATPWSGVEGVIYGASREDAESIGFDEGDKGADWVRNLEKRGIRVTGPILREEACRPFALYRELGGKVY